MTPQGNRLKQCPYCFRHAEPLYCKTNKGFDRWKCTVCKKTFSERTGTFFYRTRMPVPIIMIGILLCIFVRTRHARLLLYFIFGAKISTKSLNDWVKKFANTLPSYYPRLVDKGKKYLILHGDEKFARVNGKWHYWWSIIDNSGNLITCFLSDSRELKCAKQLMKQAKIGLNCRVDFIVTDKLAAYSKAKNLFGKSCKHIQTGIKLTVVNPKGELFWINNNPAESLNSEIDIFLSRFRYNFRSVESAERWMKIFMFRNYLLRVFERQVSSKEDSTANISLKKWMDPLGLTKKDTC